MLPALACAVEPLTALLQRMAVQRESKKCAQASKQPHAPACRTERRQAGRTERKRDPPRHGSLLAVYSKQQAACDKGWRHLPQHY
jgi:hypothetical protein